MKLLRLAAIALTLSLAACAPKLETLPVADFHAYKPDLAGVEEPATLRGSYGEKFAPLGSAEYAVGVFAINGKVAFKDARFDVPIELTPGKQSLTIGYMIRGYGDAIPVMLDAKPGGRYVIRRATDANWSDVIKYDRIRTWLYIEDERTGEVVVPKIPDIIQTIEDRYQPPSGPQLATISGTRQDGGLAAFPIAVDGKIVPEDRKGGIWLSSRWEPTKPVAIPPGTNAIAVLARHGVEERHFPVLLEAKPGASYIVKFEHGQKRTGTTRIYVHTIWVEDATTGEIVVPKADLPGRAYPTL
ncbi:MAG: hypothetical protein LPK88_00215 [Alphaproteobacteria bacterium]|nr:hypothetical protein [Alphaproteobacteria bacterium]MDX5414734.1 hypothetical protein [Alphaproteobacteria bacterium]MDX5491915.1 hypothetical protein [Alphaproteobacteria bacterium]